jgi:hypothetical protein
MSNAGDVTLQQYGTLPGYPDPVWYHPECAANVLSLHNVAKHFKVTYIGSNNQDEFRVHIGRNRSTCFQPSPNGLYYHDTSVTSENALTTDPLSIL